MAEEKWMTINKVRDHISCIAATLYRLMKNKKFPRQYKIGGMSRWNREEIDQFILESNRK